MTFDWLMLRMLKQPRTIAGRVYRVVWENSKARVYYTQVGKDTWESVPTIYDSELAAHRYLNGLNSLLGGNSGWSGN